MGWVIGIVAALVIGAAIGAVAMVYYIGREMFRNF